MIRNAFLRFLFFVVRKQGYEPVEAKRLLRAHELCVSLSAYVNTSGALNEAYRRTPKAARKIDQMVSALAENLEQGSGLSVDGTAIALRDSVRREASLLGQVATLRSRINRMEAEAAA